MYVCVCVCVFVCVRMRVYVCVCVCVCVCVNMRDGRDDCLVLTDIICNNMCMKIYIIFLHHDSAICFYERFNQHYRYSNNDYVIVMLN